MIIHCSKKLAAELPEVLATPFDETSPLGSWHVPLFALDRRQWGCSGMTQATIACFSPGVGSRILPNSAAR